jgi:hypothetical protein
MHTQGWAIEEIVQHIKRLGRFLTGGSPEGIMSLSLSCPRCGSQDIKWVDHSRWANPLGGGVVRYCYCAGCGESSRDPAHPVRMFPRLDLTVGTAVLATLATAAFSLLF